MHSETHAGGGGNVHVQIGGQKYYVDPDTVGTQVQLFQRARDGSRIPAPNSLASKVRNSAEVQRNIRNGVRTVTANGGFAAWATRAGVMVAATFSYDQYVSAAQEAGLEILREQPLGYLLTILDQEKQLPNISAFRFIHGGTTYFVAIREVDGVCWFQVKHIEEYWSLWTGDSKEVVDDIDIGEVRASMRKPGTRTRYTY